MPELEQSDSGALRDGIHSGPDDELNGLLADPPLVEREGLPRGYRMRADSHYVDHLESRHSAPAIRLIATRHIDAPAGSSPVPVAALVQSVAAHGVLQPLLVRAQNGRYHVIAGSKRLAAAIAAGLTDVPCFTYDVDEAESAALAEADNLRAPVAGEKTAPEPDARWQDVLQAVSRDLATIDSAAVLLRRAAGDALSQRVAADLIQARTWRAAWVSNAALFVKSPGCSSRTKLLGSTMERVKSGFEAQARLAGLHLEYCVAPAAAVVALDEDLGVLALTGCLFATLAWLEGGEDVRAEVRADVPNPRTLRVEVVQRTAPVPEGNRDLMVALGLSTAQAVAARYDGAVELTAIGGRGSIIRLTFCRPDAN